MTTEANVYALWAAKQTAKGTPAAAATQRMIQVAGDFDVNRDDGSENYSDLDQFGNQTDFVNTLLGNGNPTIEAQPDQLAYIAWLFTGAEAYTAKAVGTAPAKSIFDFATAQPFFSTWWKRVGLTDIVRQKFNDCIITSIRIEGSTANKVVKIIPTIISLDPGEVYLSGTEPVVAIDVVAPFLYTEGAGSFTVDGTVFTGQSQFALVVDFASTPWYGDSVTPYAMVPGNATITLDGITLLLDAASLARYYTLIYGTATPGAAAKPLKTLPALGSYSAMLSRGASDTRVSAKIEVPKVKWAPDLSIPPNPDGGAIEIALAGSMRKNPTGGAAPLAPTAARLTVERPGAAAFTT